MGIVAAKCPQCGANIKVDEEKDAGICEYCGTPFITEKAINNYNTYVTNNYAGANINVLGADYNNYIVLAQNAIKAMNEEEAAKYVNKALELKIDLPIAWITKMEVAAIGASGDNLKVDEINSYADNAIKYAPEDEKEKVQEEINKCFLRLSVFYIKFAIAIVEDYELLNKAKQAAGLNPVSMGQVITADGERLKKTEIIMGVGTAFRLRVPAEFISSHSDVHDIAQEILTLFIRFSNSELARRKSYSQSLAPDVTAARQKLLEKLKEGLPEESKQKVNSERIEPGSNSGCYIATCVYGSYDCPEVWTLRRFRDFTLDSTWYGRIFIKCYYAISPTLVKLFGDTKWFKKFWKYPLDKMVGSLKKSGVKDTYYVDKY